MNEERQDAGGSPVEQEELVAGTDAPAETQEASPTQSSGNRRNRRNRSNGGKKGNGAPVDHGLIIKGSRTAWHHLFKGAVRKMKKNLSFIKGKVEIQELEHTHIFHTVDSRLRKQTTTNMVGGHFHKIEWEMDEETGRPVVTKCSPPLRTFTRQTEAGQVKRTEQVKFRDTLQQKDVVDDHTHDFTYLSSEQLSETKIKGLQEDTRARIASQAMQEAHHAATGH